jgi:23S rRNA pseudouridine2605 synthase
VDDPDATRLNRLLAAAGVASRRGADVLIAAGRVTVDGVVADVGTRVAAGQKVAVDGRLVHAQRPVYLMLHKPGGVVTTSSDPQGRPTVIDLVKVRERVFAVGRLDVSTTGLLLVTNDGALADRLMHPRGGIRKTYHALVRGIVTEETAARLAAGVELDDGPTAPAEVTVSGRDAFGSVLEIVLREGRNRQVRRMCDAVGHPVRALRRTASPRRPRGGDLAPADAARTRRRASCRRSRRAIGHVAESTEEARALIREFREFVLRGNIIDLAVAVLIGAAFGALVTSLNDNLLTPVIGMIGGTPDFSGLSFTINDSPFLYGKFINDLISFVLIAASVFFVVVKPLNRLAARRAPEAPSTPEDIELLREIRDALRAR